jgi:hypothetical protein
MPDISNSELEVVRATAENARITADRAHRLAKGLDNEIHRVALGLEVVDRHQHWVVKLGIAVICLMALTGACAWWLNSELNAQGTSLANLLGIQKTVDNLSLRVSGTEAGLKVVAEQWQKVTGRTDERMNALDKKVGEIGKAPATRTQTASAAPNPAPTTDLENRVGQLNETVGTIPNRRDTEEAQQNEAVKSETASEMARLQSVLDRNRAKIASLSNQLDRDRHDFEISQDRALEVAPGILLTIKETNANRQEINGWVYLQGERRFQYLKNQGLHQPITVWSIQDQQAHDIVITKVRQGDALGFVLSPKSVGAVAASGAN